VRQACRSSEALGSGSRGGVGQGDVSLQLLGSIGADYAYSAGIVSFQPLTAYGIEEVLRPDFISSRATARARYHIAAPPQSHRDRNPRKSPAAGSSRSGVLRGDHKR